ncbi:SDR family NAD(P)-dependent oxidoreductase [Luteimonas fraxinea]|uniref:SDR family NAD(P)-dependent oxidoreductase n=1 Tax=Luteimonas fraxinea TaxID=2901869 RepID=A0ABS8U9B5_9GAMM|nr:SDR family NAD(P)-dependent oxidoreductase [Luteimonas fraxinea]MCD9096105.1 SDR family NAD(P)-dependent oxidoreductase [Luteimonas fraxinea]UHH10725.1 SDR family NAD(P)-dependent oxidoreductase [Luteimonas fraxinea]
MITAASEVVPGALAGRVVLVVGAAGGLGEAASLACADAGASLVLLGRRVPKLNRLHDRLQTAGAAPALYPLDLEGASPDDHAELAARIEAEFGRLDGILHVAASFDGLTPLELTDPAAFARALHVNLTARWWLTQACLPLLRRAGDSSVVFAIDDPARTTGAYWGGYGLAQAGLSALVGMLQAELGDAPVRVSGLLPPPMRTPLRARAHVEAEDRIARSPVEVAAHCVALLSSAGASRRGQLWAPDGTRSA